MQPTFPDHFSHVAARYADFRPRYPVALFDYLATVVAPDVTVWDCAAGNGQASQGLAGKFARVIATDASADQIASALPHPGVEYRVARSEHSDLPDASVGLVTVAQALHWFDLDRFYAEVKRVLVPGGVLAVWCYGINELEGAEVNAIVHEYYAGTVGPYWPPSRLIVEAGYRTLSFPFPELAAPTLRMEATWTLEQTLGYFSTWSATSRYIAATGTNPIEPLARQLGGVWGDPRVPRRVTWPLAMRVGRASAST